MIANSADQYICTNEQRFWDHTWSNKRRWSNSIRTECMRKRRKRMGYLQQRSQYNVMKSRRSISFRYYDMGYVIGIYRIFSQVLVTDRDRYRGDHDHLCRVSLCNKRIFFRKHGERKNSHHQRNHRRISDSVFICHHEIIDQCIPILGIIYSP